MPIQPKFAISGYRGIWKDTLTDEIAKKYVRALVRMLREDEGKQNPIILIGRDGRESGPEIKKSVIEELENLGVNFVDGDLLPTPTVFFAVHKHKYDAGIIITASHNPIEYNGLKFVNDKALYLDENQLAKINAYYEENSHPLAPKGTPPQAEGEKNIPDFPKEHIDQIIANVDAEIIRAQKFKVAVDMINASACALDPYFFKQLGAELVPLNDIPNGKFAHKPEPLRENLADIGNLVKSSGANLGFAHDPDADRLVIVNEFGETISEEYTLAFAVLAVLSKNREQTIVINLSTSQMSADIAEKYGSKCIRTKVGEANVVEGIIKNNAIIGGEGNGGIIYPAINMARDSFTGIGLVLEFLAKTKQTVSQCIAKMPKYFMKKAKWPVKDGGLSDIYLKLKSHFKEAEIIEIDGLRLDFPDSSWIHLRPSNTEPIIRLFGEAKTEKRIEELFKEAEDLLA
ncbi:MAG TPA: phosphoglucosamine mutase [Candidatus Paceibacterota bacterium]|jgi:phosphomannomutase|nr:phosphoglucosamine mutase [Candidatus Paceibacterota bacterium]